MMDGSFTDDVAKLGTADLPRLSSRPGAGVASLSDAIARIRDGGAV